MRTSRGRVVTLRLPAPDASSGASARPSACLARLRQGRFGLLRRAAIAVPCGTCWVAAVGSTMVAICRLLFPEAAVSVSGRTKSTIRVAGPRAGRAAALAPSISRAPRKAHHRAGSTSGNAAIFPLRGGHSTSKVLLTNLAGSKSLSARMPVRCRRPGGPRRAAAADPEPKPDFLPDLAPCGGLGSSPHRSRPWEFATPRDPCAASRARRDDQQDLDRGCNP